LEEDEYECAVIANRTEAFIFSWPSGNPSEYVLFQPLQASLECLFFFHIGISGTLQAQNATFLALASKTAALEAELQKIKVLYTQLWRAKTESVRDPFVDGENLSFGS
jgi:hypothetical protein